MLEARLDAVDENETKELYLGNHRRDRNLDRKQILDEIANALKEYDELVDRNHQMLNHTAPQPLNVVSLRNWTKNTGNPARSETAYLDASDDLLCVATGTDSFLTRVELLLERAIIWGWECVGSRVHCNDSRDPNVFIFSGSFSKRLAHASAAWGVVMVLWLPVIIINMLDSMLLRLISIIAAAAIAIMLLAVLTNAGTWEMFVAGATYSAVLVVFVSDSGLNLD